MKEIKTGTALLMIAIAFVIFCTGLYVGKQSNANSFVIRTEKEAVQTHTEKAEQSTVKQTTEKENARSQQPTTTEPPQTQSPTTNQLQESQTQLPSTTEQPQEEPQESNSEPATVQKDTRINVNTATHSELMELPGIGETLAQRIIDYRTSMGPFDRVDDLQEVRGIGEKTMDKIRDLITVGDEE